MGATKAQKAARKRPNLWCERGASVLSVTVMGRGLVEACSARTHFGSTRDVKRLRGRGSLSSPAPVADLFAVAFAPALARLALSS